MTEVVATSVIPVSSTVGGTRLVDRLDSRLVNVLTVVGFGLPILGYFWLIYRYSVNVIYQDQWSDVTVIQHSYSNLFDWGTLWAQHNENRIFFPNLIVVFLAHTSHFNIQVEEYLSATMLMIATALLIWSHKRRTPSAPWLYYCPVAFLTLSVVQYGNTLWGFQMAWYLVLLSLAIVVALMDRQALTWFILTGAILFAVVGSFSSLQGLLIWPTGLVLLYCRHRRTTFAIAWIAAASITALIYFYRFNFGAGNPCARCYNHHPTDPVKFFLFAVGDVLGISAKIGGNNTAVLAFGLVIVILAIAILGFFGFRRDELSGRPIGVALVCFGLLFAIVTAKGRAVLGYTGAEASRYTTYDLLIVVGIYLALLGQPIFRRQDQPVGRRQDNAASTPNRWSIRLDKFESVVRTARPVTSWIVAAIIVLQIGFGLQNGLLGARANNQSQLQSAYVARHVDRTSDDDVVYYLDISKSASFTRRQVRTAEKFHLSLFAGNGP